VTDPDLRDPNLDRAYRETPRDEPPSELDERIRAAARRALGTKPQSLEQQTADRARRGWTSRWRVPLSVAATLVIAATLTVMMQEEERRPRDDAGRAVSPAIVAPMREAERPASPAAGAPDAARSAPAPAAQPPAPPGAAPDAPVRARAAPAPALEPTTRPGAAPEPKREERALEAQRPAAAEQAPATPGQLEMRRQTAVPAASPPPPAAPAPAPKPALQSQPAGAASDVLRRDRALGDRPERASREASGNALRSPEAWVELIRSLRAQGRDAEATAELAELRRAYPDFQLPPDLAR
jgi:hypothetical protein